MSVGTISGGHLIVFEGLLPTIVQWTIQAISTLQEGVGEIDSIAFRGHSGASIAYPVSVATGIGLSCIRKESDKAHCRRSIIGVTKCDRYVIVDDFISSGKTVKDIMKNMKKAAAKKYKNECAGIILYYGNPCSDYNSAPQFTKEFDDMFSVAVLVPKQLSYKGRV